MIRLAARPAATDSLVRRDAPDADRVAERIADAEVAPVALIGGLLGDVDPRGLEPLELAVDVIREEGEPAAARPLAHELAHLLLGGGVVRGHPRTLEQDVVLLARHAHREPAHRAELHIGAHLEAEQPHVELERLVLIEHEDRRQVVGCQHGSSGSGSCASRYESASRGASPKVLGLPQRMMKEPEFGSIAPSAAARYRLGELPTISAKVRPKVPTLVNPTAKQISTIGASVVRSRNIARSTRRRCR